MSTDEFRARNIIYYPRDQYRKSLRALTHNPKFNKLPLSIFKQLYISSRLFSPITKSKTLLISEENILGDCVELLSTIPYSMNRLEFIRIMSRKVDTTVYFSIRDFSTLLPGAYATSLKYSPRKALTAKASLIDDISCKRYPSWIDVYERIKNFLPNVKIKIWNQEAYRHNPEIVFREFTNITDFKPHKIPDPLSTITPSLKAIKIVEENVRKGNYIKSDNWFLEVEKIFEEHQAKDLETKFRLFDSETTQIFKKKYQQELSYFEAQNCLVSI
ncbi:hypothetical protein [Alteromonas halophila]|nr:hypothetical protein [Alteromonas halophila]